MAVPDYTKRAIAKYQSGKDRLNLMLEPGTKDRIKERYGKDVSLNGYIKGLIETDLSTPKEDISEPPEPSGDVPEWMQL